MLGGMYLHCFNDSRYPWQEYFGPRFQIQTFAWVMVMITCMIFHGCEQSCLSYPLLRRWPKRRLLRYLSPPFDSFPPNPPRE